MPLLEFRYPFNLILLLTAVWVYLRARAAASPGVPGKLWQAWLRMALVTLLVLGASGVRVPARGSGEAVVFVVDRSDSVSEAARARSRDEIRRLTASMSSGDRAGLVVFGRESVVERPLSDTLAFDSIRSRANGTATDIAAALELAAEMLTDGPGKRVVLLSDGNQTLGDATTAAAVLSARGIVVDAVPLDVDRLAADGEVLVARVAGPDRVEIAEPFEVTVDVLGPRGSDVDVELRLAGELLTEEPVTLERDGRGRVSFAQRIAKPGLHRFDVVIDGANDRLASNNRGALLVQVAGRPTVACLCAASEVRALAEILSRHGFIVEIVPPDSIKAARLDDYEALIVANVPATELTPGQISSIAEYVDARGGGLLMTGGARSFGPGGYAGTPVEDALPIRMEVGDAEEKPDLALVLMLDKSGSMAGEARGVEKLTAAKEAAESLLLDLAPGDSLGIIAFDSAAWPVVELRRVDEMPPLGDLLGEVDAAGGTSIEPAMRMASAWLEGSGSAKRHALLLSDGQDETGSLERLGQVLAGSDVTFSTVGIGDDVDRAYLSRLADLTGGRAYFTPAAGEIAAIFAREARRISREWVVERRFRPEATGAHPILGGIDRSTLPFLNGYVASTAKATARSILVSDTQEPILAAWHYGMGRAVALTTDLDSSWTADLSQWKSFEKLWSQTVRWISRRPLDDGLQVGTRAEGEVVTLVVDAFDEEGGFDSSLTVRALVRAPDDETFDVELDQTSAGRYEGGVVLDSRGPYVFRVTAGEVGSDREERSVVLGFDASILPEYKSLGADLGQLGRIAEAGGGSILAADETVYGVSDAPPVSRDASQIAGIAALLLFLIDVVLRRR